MKHVPFDREWLDRAIAIVAEEQPRWGRDQVAKVLGLVRPSVTGEKVRAAWWRLGLGKPAIRSERAKNAPPRTAADLEPLFKGAARLIARDPGASPGPIVATTQREATNQLPLFPVSVTKRGFVG